MRTFFIIQLLAYSITVILHIATEIGIFAQLILGWFHVISFFFVGSLQLWKKNNLTNRQLFIYLISVLIYFSVLTFSNNLLQGSSNKLLWYLIVIIIPMVIGAYFVYITYLIQKNRNEPKHS